MEMKQSKHVIITVYSLDRDSRLQGNNTELKRKNKVFREAQNCWSSQDTVTERRKLDTERVPEICRVFRLLLISMCQWKKYYPRLEK